MTLMRAARSRMRSINVASVISDDLVWGLGMIALRHPARPARPVDAPVGAPDTGGGGGRAVPCPHDPRRLEEDAEVQPERHVFEVVEVVPELLHLLLDGVRVPVSDLRPPGDPRADRAPERVVRDRVARHVAQVADHQDQESEIRDRMGPRPHEVHVAAEDVDELGQFVQPKSPEPFPDARDPIAVVLLPLGLGAARGVHGPELDQPEGQPGLPTRSWMKNTGPRESSLISSTIRTKTGASTIRPTTDTRRLRARESA